MGIIRIIGWGRWLVSWDSSLPLLVGVSRAAGSEVIGMAGVQVGRLEVESIVRAPLVVIADPVVAASGPPVTLDDVAGGGAVLLERPAGSMLVLSNPAPDGGLFVWVTARSLAVMADPDHDPALIAVGELTVCSGRLVVGAPEVVAAWGPDVDTGDGSVARARMHRGRTRLGLIVVAHTPLGHGVVTVGAGAAAVSFPNGAGECAAVPLALAG
jgi:hypothetical protein